MRVLMVNTGFLPVPPDKGGSIELHTYYLSNELSKLGLEIEYVTSVNPSSSFHPNVVLHKLPRIPFDFHGGYIKNSISFIIGGISAFIKALNAICDNKYDLIHVHGHISGICLLPLKNKAIFVFTAHNPNPWMIRSFSNLKQAYRIWAFQTIELTIVRAADHVISVSEKLREEFINRFKINPEKITTIHNGVDVNFFRPGIKNSESIFSKYQLPNEYILFVGRLVEQKGIHYLLKALKGTRIHLVIVGRGSLLQFLREMCKRLDIVQQVHFIGSIPILDLRKIYSRAMFVVIPSVAEGFPGGLVALEAMASGLPVVASKTEGIENIIKDGYNGFLFKVGDIKELRSCIIRLYEDRDLVKIMGIRSRKIVEERFSWDVVAKQTMQLYRSLLKRC